ncbi:multidrug effflux MFS transporter [Deinococcus petrolearius]|uniref:Multidrug effflux MFS transporter n=1 Tax=Deinococcus petrolearius TaxID=1751295 RepID=A0ABW1DNA1_9DEIO
MSHAASTSSAPPALPAGLIGLLALLTAIAPLATDMYLPAFPAMSSDLQTTASTVQLTLTTFLLGLAIGQLVIGPLSDQWGRRGLLLAGTALCALAGVACALTPSADFLIVARFLQGFGGAAGVVLSRAVLTDRSSGPTTAKLFSLLMLIGGVAPVIAPLVGGVLSAGLGWRGVFWVLGALSGLMLLGIVAAVPETLPPQRRRAGGLRTLADDTRSVLRNRAYLGYTLSFAFSMAAMFAYIAASPFVLQNMLGLSELAYSAAFAVNALGLMIVSGLNAALVTRHGAPRLLAVGVRVLMVLAALLLADITLLRLPLWPTLLLFFALVSSLGLIFGNAASLATSEVRQMAGTGSAILGALQFSLAAAVSPLVGLAGEHSALPMGVTVLVAASLALLFHTALLRAGQARAINA